MASASQLAGTLPKVRNSPLKKNLMLPLLLILSQIAGCVSVPKDNATNLDREVRQQQLQSFTDWQLEGRIGLSSATEAVSGSIQWQQSGTGFDIALVGPLGRRIVITQEETQASLSASGQGVVYGERADVLLGNALGIPVPLGQLSTWIKGGAGQGADTGYDQFGRLVQLGYTDADGTRWVASIKRYRQLDASGFEGLRGLGVTRLDLPGLIEISSDSYAIRLLINEWLPPPARTIDSSTDNGGDTSSKDDRGAGRLAIPGT